MASPIACLCRCIFSARVGKFGRFWESASDRIRSFNIHHPIRLIHSRKTVSEMASPALPPNRNRAGEVHAFTWTLEIISLAFVVGRMYSRVKLTRNVWWDDWCVCIALVSESESETK